MYVFDEFFWGGSRSVPLVHRDAEVKIYFYFFKREKEERKRKTVRNSRERFISANLKINSRRKGRKKRNLVLREKYKRAAAGGRTDGRTFPAQQQRRRHFVRGCTEEKTHSSLNLTTTR
jgi:hypothetical protein